MKRSLEKIIKVLFIIIVITALAAPRAVLAQDVVPTEEPAATEVVTTDVPTEAPVIEETAVVTEAATEVATEVVTELPTEVETEEATEAAVETAAPTETPVEEESVAEVVEVLAEEEAILVDDEGNPIALGSTQAEEALSEADPWFGNGDTAYAYFSAQAACDSWNLPANRPAGYAHYSCTVNSTPIQAAINDSRSTGQTIHLSGTFSNETINITKSVTIDGGGGGATTINAPSDLISKASNANRDIDTNGDDYYGLIFINAANNITVIIRNLILNGGSVTNSSYSDNKNAVGILVGNANVTLENLEILNFKRTGSGADNGIGVLSYNNPKTVTLNYNTITGNNVGVQTVANSEESWLAGSNNNILNNTRYNLDFNHGNLPNNWFGLNPADYFKNPKDTEYGDYFVVDGISYPRLFAKCQGMAENTYPPCTFNGVSVSILSGNYSTIYSLDNYKKFAVAGKFSDIEPYEIWPFVTGFNCPVGQILVGGVCVPKPNLVITASSPTITYGQSVPAITYSKNPNVTIATPPTCSSTVTGKPNVGTYTNVTTCTGASDPNYNISYLPGTVTVTKAPLTITASSETMVYGGTVPAISPIYSGWVNGESESVLTTAPTCTTTATSSSPVALSPYDSSCTGADAANYSFAYLSGTVTVTKAPLTITASSGTMVYGGRVPAISPIYSGWVNGESESVLTVTPTCTTTATSLSPMALNPYSSSCLGGFGVNYNISYLPGTVTITKALVTITASSETMVYGGTVPAISPIYSGWVDGESESVLTTAPTCTTTATSSSPVALSPYGSSCAGAIGANYSFAYLPGTVTVTKAPLTITASSGTMVYGGTVPAISPIYSGWVNGESESVLTTIPTCTTTATSSSPVALSPYSSSCIGADAANYNINNVNGTVSVTPAPLAIAASFGNFVAGGTVPTITPSYTGLVAGNLSPATPPTCSTTATSASPAGTYPSTCSLAADSNYSITYVAGLITITAAPSPGPIIVPVTGATPALAIPVTGGALIPVTGGTLIVSGLGHSCMTYNNGQVICWGLNASGQLGDGTTADKLEPVYVKDLMGVQNLTAGGKHTCALTIDGEIWCWGENSSGQLGNGTTTNSSVPVKVAGLPDKVLSITAGEEFTCVQLMNQEVWCWGKNDLGQLNDGTTKNQSSPVKSKLTTMLAQISGGQGLLLGSDVLGSVNEWVKAQAAAVKELDSSLSISANRWADKGCAVAVDGSVKCWDSDLLSIPVTGALSAMEVGTGLDHNCSINTDESISCWGSNDSGQLGDGTNKDSASATLVKNLTKAHALAVGASHTCILSGASNIAYCWGENSFGQLGNNTTTNSNVPVLVTLPK